MSRQVAVFPYPVLSESDDFNHPLADDAAQYYDDSDLDTYRYQVDLKINDPDILNLIKDGKAEYFIQVDCVSTNYRFCDRFSTGKYKLDIPKTNVLNDVSISCYIIASEAIDNYSCKDFNDTYYQDEKFHLDEGDILVIFRNYNFNTRINNLKNASLGDYIEFREANTERVSFDLADIIYITLPKKVYKQYQSNKDLIEYNSAILHSSFVMVALIEALQKFNANLGTTWARSIAIQLKADGENFSEGVDYHQDEDGQIIEIINPVEVATKILKDPFSRMLENMKIYQPLTTENNG